MFLDPWLKVTDTCTTQVYVSINWC